MWPKRGRRPDLLVNSGGGGMWVYGWVDGIVGGLGWDDGMSWDGMQLFGIRGI